jgi:hypothetical protein
VFKLVRSDRHHGHVRHHILAYLRTISGEAAGEPGRWWTHDRPDSSRSRREAKKKAATRAAIAATLHSAKSTPGE